MKKTKMEKGITLIALIITIVILLILAVVTIGAIRNSRIITHSQNASNDYTVAQEKEKIQLALSEWQIQKNKSENTETFKSIIETELEKNATVSGNNNGPLNITFNNTGNKYRITDDGKIGEAAKLTGTSLEKYIFGDNLKGRNIYEIVEYTDDDELKFINFNSDEEITAICSCTEDIAGENTILQSYYVKYNNEMYKFRTSVNTENMTFTTDTFYGITKIKLNTENTRVGKTVSYDGKTWTILYDDDINGLQMISDETFKYNNKELDLGWRSSYFSNLDKIDGVEFDGELGVSGLEKVVYIYNNAIKILNETCESLVTKNNNIVSVRSVGSDPIYRNSENNETYSSYSIKNNPQNNSKYKPGIVDNKLKSTDLNYINDFDRMIALKNIFINSRYWLASRMVIDLPMEEEPSCDFAIRRVGENEINYTGSVGVFDEQLVWDDSGVTAYLRPVVKLKSDVQFSGTGTETDPYTF